MCRFQMCRLRSTIAPYPIICTSAYLHICTSGRFIFPKCGQPQPFLNIPQDEKLINTNAPNNINLLFNITNCTNCYHYTKYSHAGSKAICKQIAPIGAAPYKNGKLQYLNQPAKNNSYKGN